MIIKKSQLKLLIEIQPAHVHDLIVKMLASDPDKRITSSEVVVLLEEFRNQVRKLK
jgi:serine/threonine-protein kinase/endoribonuclease IRE1